MQIQHPPQDKEIDPIADLVIRLKIAYRFITAKKAIVIIDNELDIFNTDPQEVFEICSQIVGDFAEQMFEDIEQNIAIHNLVHNS